MIFMFKNTLNPSSILNHNFHTISYLKFVKIIEKM